MSLKDRIRKTIEREEREYESEQRMKEKRSEEYEVLEEVFDRSTLMVIYEFMNKGLIKEIYGAVDSGKESRIYWGIGPDDKEIAIKVFLTVAAEFRRGRLQYIVGDPRFENVKRNLRHMVYQWAQKEFRNLKLAYGARVRVPRPIAVKKNVLLMEFIGEKGVSAPLLKDAELEDPERMYKRILVNIKRLYRGAKLVHGDLSEYNIMIWKGRPVLFDFSQAVSIEHPAAEQFLIRDIMNINRFFSKIGVNVIDVERIYGVITGGTAALREDT